MKCISKILLITVVPVSFLYQASLYCGWSSAFKAVSTGIEIAGHVATGVDVAMNIANVGVTLWGSDKDRERMAKGLGITSVITSIARGDFETAQAQAENIRGLNSDKPQYTPLTGDDLIDADIVPMQPTSIARRSFGDTAQVSNEWIDNLRKNKKVITIDDMKIAQFGIIKNQLVFAAKMPQSAGEQKLYQLMNGMEIMFSAFANITKPTTMQVICYRITTEGGVTKSKEFGSITLPKSELDKDFFIGTTNNQLSIFHKEGNDIIKTNLIPKMVE